MNKDFMLKIDFDGKWEDFIKVFKFRYNLLYSYKVIPNIQKVEVFKTRHGYHIYLYSFVSFDFNQKLLLEAILGDDLNRVAYNYCEKQDILYKQKRDIDVKFVKSRTNELYKLLYRANQQKTIIKGEFK